MAESILSGKTIFISGGSIGLGFAAAKACAEAGARVIIAARTEKDLKSAQDELLKISAGHEYHVLDVSDLSAVQKCAEWAGRKFGKIDGLVSCAGIYGPIGPLNEINLPEFERAIKINFLGTVFLCSSFAPFIKKGGRIINYSGGGAATPFANYSAYATSKIAIVRLSENLAEEYVSLGISVNSVAPGFVVTRMHQDTLQAGESKAGKAFLQKTKEEMGKGGVAPEVSANLAVFLLSEKAEGINGKFISAPWDDWKNPAFQDKLKSQKNFCTLRRIDNKGFTEVQR